MVERVKIEVQGIVQGVGFRPFVYRLAERFGVAGSILNTESGVAIEVEGDAAAVEAFVAALTTEAPPLARIVSAVVTQQVPRGDASFVILPSVRANTANTFLSPDIATCPDCVAELLNPQDRRYHYPFLNCTNCGPRFTIICSVPYDRAQTAMAGFTMCAACQAEYDDPGNRRFHAQPNACPACGPHVALLDAAGVEQAGDAVEQTARLLSRGHIVAIKGLGGFHLAVDATNPEAVQTLRNRKGRGDKPFAVMVQDSAAARGLCLISDAEAAVLESPQRPIVLLQKRDGRFDSLAPDADRLGVFLPYTPLHHLLFTHPDVAALVMTSGNLTDEPIAIDNHEALSRLGTIADYFLVHNRDILLRADDSVVQCIGARTQFIRRSRGYVPAPIPLAGATQPILAVGGELKNIICVSRNGFAFPGQHIGDLEGLSAYEFFRESVEHMQAILEVTPKVIAHDLHPAYLSTQWAKQQAGGQLIGIQHHHAHIASCMAENGLTGPVIGIALDGTGYGTDGAAWGGEILVADLGNFQRAAHLGYVAMPGNAQAIHQPWRMAVSHLVHTFGDSWREYAPTAWLASVPQQHVRLVEQMLRTSTNAPLTSSCGRLFDAVAALVLGRATVTYEAQAAIELEACCSPSTGLGEYPIHLTDDACIQLDTRPLFAAIVRDISDAVPAATISRRFHDGLAAAFANAVQRVAVRAGLTRVCLSGGVFLNAVLTTALECRLTAAGLTVFTHSQVSPGDGGLSLGQLAIAANVIGLTSAAPQGE